MGKFWSLTLPKRYIKIANLSRLYGKKLKLLVPTTAKTTVDHIYVQVERVNHNLWLAMRYIIEVTFNMQLQDYSNMYMSHIDMKKTSRRGRENRWILCKCCQREEPDSYVSSHLWRISWKTTANDKWIDWQVLDYIILTLQNFSRNVTDIIVLASIIILEKGECLLTIYDVRFADSMLQLELRATH